MVTLEELKETVADVLNVEEEALQPETDLYSLPDFDSVAILGLMVALDDIGIEVPQNKVSEMRTYGDLIEVTGLAS